MATSSIEKLSPSMYLFLRNTGASWVRRSRMCERAFSSAFSLPFELRFSSVDTCTNSSFSKLSKNKRMREALVDVLVDDVRLVQDQVALDQDGYLAVRVHHADVFGLVIEIDVADL